jgi:hypothetical protein
MVSASSMPVSETKRASYSFFLYEKGKYHRERTIQYIKDRTEEGFDDYFPYKRKKYKLKYVKNWLKLFIDYHNKEINLK